MIRLEVRGLTIVRTRPTSHHFSIGVPPGDDPDPVGVKVFLWTVSVVNHGSPGEVRVKVTKIEPAIVGLSIPAPLHVRNANASTVQLASSESEQYEFVSLGRTTTDPEHWIALEGEPPQAFLHDARGVGGVEGFRAEGNFRMTLTAYAGERHVERTYVVQLTRHTLVVTAE